MMNILELLNHHQHRRQEGIPTISVLTGPTGLAQYFWQTWTRQCNHQPIILPSRTCGIRDILQAWLSHNSERIQWQHEADGYLASRIDCKAGQISATLKGKTAFELELWLQRMFAGGPANNAERLCLHILQQNRYRLTLNDLTLLFGQGDEELIRAIQGIMPMLPETYLPCLMIVHVQEAHHAAIKLAAGILEKIAVQNVTLPVALALNMQPYQKFLQHAPESRLKTLLRETIITLQSLEPEQIKNIIGKSAYIRHHLPATAVQRLAADGATEELILDFKEALQTASTVTPDNMAQADRARSAAERFLFNRLETHPKTAGLFELNGKLDVRFGRRLMEVDLLSKRRRIAIEIDGYFHFVNAGSYRKDRLKDLILQKHGYLVVRFLAADIVQHFEVVLNTILDSILFKTVTESNGGAHEHP